MRFRDLPIPVANAKKTFQSIRLKYPSLRTYLVVSTRLGQIHPDESSGQVLRQFPSLFLESADKAQALGILQRLSRDEQKLKSARGPAAVGIRKVISALGGLLDLAVLDLEIDTSAQVELRFDELDFALVRTLQISSLVDQARTPQSRASIQIVLGTLEDFSERETHATHQDCPEERRLPQIPLWMPSGPHS